MATTKPGNSSVLAPDYDVKCQEYVSSTEFSNNKKSNPDLYKECCEVLNYCPFWKEPWFIYTMVGVGSFVAISFAICIAWCCCCRDGRSRGRGDVEFSETEEEKGEIKNERKK